MKKTTDPALSASRHIRGCYTESMKTKFWTPQCSTCPKCKNYVDEKGYVPYSRYSRRRGRPPFCLWGKEPRRLIHANIERNCQLKEKKDENAG